MKKKIILILLCLFSLLIAVGTITFYFDSKSDNSLSSTNNYTNFETDYYTFSLPNNVSAIGKNNYETVLFSNAKKVGEIDVNLDCSYSTATSSIISNWMGMHAYAKNDILEKEFDNYKMSKVLIAFEQSAAQQESGTTPEPDQLHYFYTKNNSSNMFIDLYINTGFISEENADSIADSLLIK